MTTFQSGSFADNHNPHALAVLREYWAHTRGVAPGSNAQSGLTHDQIVARFDSDGPYRRSVLRQCGHIATLYFDARAVNFWATVLREVFGIEDATHKYEPQTARGCIHYHGTSYSHEQWQQLEAARQAGNAARAQAVAEDDGSPDAALDRAFEGAMAANLEQWLQSSSVGCSPFFTPGATSPGFVSMHPAGGRASVPAGDGTRQWVPRKELWAPPEGTAPKPLPSPLTLSLRAVLQSEDGVLVHHRHLTNRLMLHNCSGYCLTKWHKLVDTVVKVIRWCKACRMHFGWRDPATKKMTGMPLHEWAAVVIRVSGGSPRYDGRRDHRRMVASIVATLVRQSRRSSRLPSPLPPVPPPTSHPAPPLSPIPHPHVPTPTCQPPSPHPLPRRSPGT